MTAVTSALIARLGGLSASPNDRGRIAPKAKRGFDGA